MGSSMLSGLIFDCGKDSATHYAVYTIRAALFCLIFFANCNYFAVHSFETPIKFSIYCISYFEHCCHKYHLRALFSEVLFKFNLNPSFYFFID